VRAVEVASASGPMRGTFLGWGIGFEEFNIGTGHITMAIVEWPNGKVDLVHPSIIRFLTPTTSPQPGELAP